MFKIDVVQIVQVNFFATSCSRQVVRVVQVVRVIQVVQVVRLVRVVKVIRVLQVVQAFHVVLVVSSGGPGLSEVVRMVRVASVDDRHSENIWFSLDFKPLNH